MEKANPDSVVAEKILSGTGSPTPEEYSLPPYPANPGRAEALPLIKAVRDRLEAWRDDAQMRLQRSPPGQEAISRNMKENYAYLAELLLQAELALSGGMGE